MPNRPHDVKPACDNTTKSLGNATAIPLNAQTARKRHAPSRAFFPVDSSGPGDPPSVTDGDEDPTNQ
jgi:hypothetical protein